jgi:hypothetical protein
MRQPPRKIADRLSFGPPERAMQPSKPLLLLQRAQPVIS